MDNMDSKIDEFLQIKKEWLHQEGRLLCSMVPSTIQGHPDLHKEMQIYRHAVVHLLLKEDWSHFYLNVENNEMIPLNFANRHQGCFSEKLHQYFPGQAYDENWCSMVIKDFFLALSADPAIMTALHDEFNKFLLHQQLQQNLPVGKSLGRIKL